MEACYHLFFETLGTELKIDILTILKESPLSVNEIAQRVYQERSKVSHALKSLSKCGFVYADKEGRSRIYSLNSKTIMPLLNLVDKHTRKYCKICKHGRKKL